MGANMTSRLATAGLASLLVLGSGCRTNMGPTTISPARFDYNQAIAASWNEQLLLNLVRLRYRDTVHFLEVSSVITQYSLEHHASASAGAVFNGSTIGAVGLGAGITY